MTVARRVWGMTAAGSGDAGDTAGARPDGVGYVFATDAALALEVAFDGGRLTSDGGLPWLAEADRSLDLCRALAACIPDRRAAHIRHTLETLMRQRVFQIVCGYADQNDADTLRADPLLKLVCGRRPESGPDLASRPSRAWRTPWTATPARASRAPCSTST